MRKIFLNKRVDGSEIVNYDYEGFPALIKNTPPQNMYDAFIDSHWHDDFEFLVIQSGSISCLVNGQTITLYKGDGLLINSRQVHNSFPHGHDTLEYYCVLLSPSLLYSSVPFGQKFILPFTADAAIPFIKLSPETGWQKSILDQLDCINRSARTETAPLQIEICFYRIWLLLYENIIKNSDPAYPVSNRSLPVLKSMLAFIQNHYSEKISLADIAASGHVSKSTCGNIFKYYLKDTPADYLLKYRIKIGSELLTGTENSVSDIAFESGFSSLSYFSECFRKHFGKTPLQFRRQFSVSAPAGKRE